MEASLRIASWNRSLNRCEQPNCYDQLDPIFSAQSLLQEARIKQHNWSTCTIESRPLPIPTKRRKCFKDEINQIMNDTLAKVTPDHTVIRAILQSMKRGFYGLLTISRPNHPPGCH